MCSGPSTKRRCPPIRPLGLTPLAAEAIWVTRQAKAEQDHSVLHHSMQWLALRELGSRGHFIHLCVTVMIPQSDTLPMLSVGDEDVVHAAPACRGNITDHTLVHSNNPGDFACGHFGFPTGQLWRVCFCRDWAPCERWAVMRSSQCLIKLKRAILNAQDGHAARLASRFKCGRSTLEHALRHVFVLPQTAYSEGTRSLETTPYIFKQSTQLLQEQFVEESRRTHGLRCASPSMPPDKLYETTKVAPWR
jgi:hypothetical protein